MHVLLVIASMSLGQAATFPAVILEASWRCGGTRSQARQELVATPDTTPRLEIPEACGGPSHAALRIRCAERCTGWIEADGARVAELSLENPERLFEARRPLPVTLERARGTGGWLSRLRLAATPLEKLIVQREEVFADGPLELRLRSASRSARHRVTPGEAVSLSTTPRVIARVTDASEESATLELRSDDAPPLRLKLPVGSGRATVPCQNLGWACTGTVELTLTRAGARVQR